MGFCKTKEKKIKFNETIAEPKSFQSHDDHEDQTTRITLKWGAHLFTIQLISISDSKYPHHLLP